MLILNISRCKYFPNDCTGTRASPGNGKPDIIDCHESGHVT